ncbi:hypothetical protein [Limnoglobus roseus]|uniref:Uncharacterized protein n=1 Tax=Limnoglobus roseus TaxID=2598579 RepID=A0A5C1AEA1_9BACT|nr:hypothetical protein [Limnoglobus roseus]QEL17709.1 hypothetical protein PX52LOC_04708 [Limnoglobus roseus]
MFPVALIAIVLSVGPVDVIGELGRKPIGALTQAERTILHNEIQRVIDDANARIRELEAEKAAREAKRRARNLQNP